MSTHSIDQPAVSMHSTGKGRDVWRGILTGLAPLVVLVIAVTATLLLTALARLLFAGSGFFAQQQAGLIVLIAGLILSIACFGLAVWRALRRVALWQLIEARARAAAALWALGATALVIVLPVLLALLLPQHPAP